MLRLDITTIPLFVTGWLQFATKKLTGALIPYLHFNSRRGPGPYKYSKYLGVSNVADISFRPTASQGCSSVTDMQTDGRTDRATEASVAIAGSVRGPTVLDRCWRTCIHCYLSFALTLL